MAKPKKPQVQQELITEEDLDEDENLDDLNDEEPDEDEEEDEVDEDEEEIEAAPEVELPKVKPRVVPAKIQKAPSVPKQLQVAKETLIPGFLAQLTKIKEGVGILTRTPKLANAGRKLDEAMAWLKGELSSK